MSKSKKKLEPKARSTDLVEETKEPYIITDASVKDGFCNYVFEVTEEVGFGDQHSVKGKGIVDDDLFKAFTAFNLHMAIIDDVFKHGGIDINHLEDFTSHEHAFLFTVTGFSIKGSGENESIILSASKWLSTGGRMEMKSPKIPLDNLSSYRWHAELKEAADVARMEVALYKEGKYTPVEVEDEKDDPKQTKITFDGAADGQDTDFENSKV